MYLSILRALVLASQTCATDYAEKMDRAKRRLIRGSLDSELAQAYSFLRYDEGLRMLLLLSVVLLHRDRAFAQGAG